MISQKIKRYTSDWVDSLRWGGYWNIEYIYFVNKILLNLIDCMLSLILWRELKDNNLKMTKEEFVWKIIFFSLFLYHLF